VTLLQGIKSDIERISKTVADLGAASQEPGLNRPAAMAQYLSQFYTGLESCLEKKLKLKAIDLPTKTDRYHKALLKLSLDEGLLLPSCAHITTDLLSFRHFARHAYGADFQPKILDQKAIDTEKAWSEIKSLWQAELEKSDN
jgi:hypothetical protein